ncbi:hypothetical protein ACLOJK_033354 [Asimina triloba]
MNIRYRFLVLALDFPICPSLLPVCKALLPVYKVGQATLHLLPPLPLPLPLPLPSPSSSPSVIIISVVVPFILLYDGDFLHPCRSLDLPYSPLPFLRLGLPCLSLSLSLSPLLPASSSCNSVSPPAPHRRLPAPSRQLPALCLFLDVENINTVSIILEFTGSLFFYFCFVLLPNKKSPMFLSFVFLPSTKPNPLTNIRQGIRSSTHSCGSLQLF